MSAEEAQRHVAAQMALDETPVERQQRQVEGREAS